MSTFPNLIPNKIPIPAWWKSTYKEITEVLTRLQRGRVETLSTSPGGRDVKAVFYGEAEPHLMGAANFNSALGSGDAAAYVRRSERERPVMVILAGTHGHEVEGMMAAMSLLQILETGRDLKGEAQPALAEILEKLRLVIIPIANPDGRARCPYNGWVGLPQDEMTKWGQGTRKNGELYRWAPCKAVHPMCGDVGILGAYFDDNGINMMHDNWAAPMSATTSPLLQLVAREAPDCLINLHSYSNAPGVLQVHYAPHSHQKRVFEFAQKYHARIEDLKFRAAALPPDAPLATEKPNGSSQSFNLQSLFFHIGSDFNILFESPHGNVPNSTDYDYDSILEIHHHLFACAAEELLSKV